MDLSIIIVNYKSQHLILQCIQSILKFEQSLSFEIVVVDNNSNDDTEHKLKEIYPNLKWIQMGYNSGFGRANNAGIRQAEGEQILLLNSDIILHNENTLYDCLNEYHSLENHDRIVFGTRLVNTDGSYQETLRLNFPGIKREIRANALYILFVQRLLKLNVIRQEKETQKEAHYISGPVKWINGAFLLMKRQVVIDDNLLFDRDFFLYGEDIEWSWRANKIGLQFYHWANKELTHIGSASSSNEENKNKQVLVSDWLYIRKSRGRIYLFLTFTIIITNHLLDKILFNFARLRGKSELAKSEHSTLKFLLIKKFSKTILFSKTLSSEQGFKTNCYDKKNL